MRLFVLAHELSVPWIVWRMSSYTFCMIYFAARLGLEKYGYSTSYQLSFLGCSRVILSQCLRVLNVA